VLSPTYRPLFIIQQAEHFILGAARLALLARDKHAEILVEGDLDRGLLFALLLALLLVVGVVGVFVFVALFSTTPISAPSTTASPSTASASTPSAAECSAVRGHRLLQLGSAFRRYGAIQGGNGFRGASL
jgi:hypothetical protein